jgi:hypothetical protein
LETTAGDRRHDLSGQVWTGQPAVRARDAADAHRALEARKTSGSTVLTI